MAAFREYENYDALGLAALIAGREVTAEEALEAAIARTEARNSRINAVVHTMYDEARRTISDGLPTGPLSGAPFMLKDLYALYTGAPVSNGSHLFDGFVADHDLTLVARMRAAGLVVMGKTNTPEFGLNAATEPIVHGATRNPWDTARSAGGSSGGATAAVAAGMLPMAHATDGGGSIRIPAANCGLFGLKPTRGRNPSGPDIGEGWSGLASGHVVSRSVRDSAALLDAVAGPAPGDPYWAPSLARPLAEEVGADPGRLRIGLLTAAPSGVPVDPECVAATEAAARLCEELGHDVEEASPNISMEAVLEALRTIIASNVRMVMDLRLRALGREQREGDVEAITALWAEEGLRASGADYARAVLAIHVTGRRFGQFFDDYDLLLSPTLAQPPLPLGAIDMMWDDMGRYYEALGNHIQFTPQFNATGCPAATLPLHWTADGLPVGVQLGARFGDEATLIRISSQIEAARPWWGRRPPGLEPASAD
jgi:Asp-tRNA(Asn)/Glu-tRNA(Gln) amidotransferase A subunit family amidase